MRRFLSLLLAAVVAFGASSCAHEKTVDTRGAATENEGENAAMPQTNTQTTHQLIRDLAFRQGISLLSQKDHEHGDAYRELAKHDFYGGTATAPVWQLGQWDSGPDLVASLVDAPADTLTDGKWRTFRYDADENTMTFRLDTTCYYQGSPAVQGGYWPHLLIEQCTFAPGEAAERDRPYYNCDADKMIVSFDIRLGDYSATPVEGDWVRAAQFLLFLYVKGVETDDFCWLGLRLFDSRWETTDHYIGYDNGNPSTSGAMIYSIGSKYVYQNAGASLWKNGKPQPNGPWVHVELDVKPYLEDMLRHGGEDGYFKASGLADLRLDGMNVGWETIGTFDHTMQIRDLQLVSYREN